MQARIIRSFGEEIAYTATLFRCPQKTVKSAYTGLIGIFVGMMLMGFARPSEAQNANASTSRPVSDKTAHLRLLHLKDGSRLRGVIEEITTTYILLRTQHGKLKLQRDNVVKITFQYPPSQPNDVPKLMPSNNTKKTKPPLLRVVRLHKMSSRHREVYTSNIRMMLSGGIIFGTALVISCSVGMFGVLPMLIPIVGPFITAATMTSGYSSFYPVFAGVAQITGLVLFILGAANIHYYTKQGYYALHPSQPHQQRPRLVKRDLHDLPPPSASSMMLIGVSD